MKPTKAYDLEAATALLNEIAARLTKLAWFGKHKWLCSVHTFPPAPAKPESVTLHIYKEGWYNNEHQGIHFETNLSAKEWKEKSVPVTLHILHTSHIPDTNIKRIKLSQPFVDQIFDLVSSWSGYTFLTGKYGTQPFMTRVAIDVDHPSQYLSRMTEEFTRLCQKLGPIMDKTIAEVAKQN